MFIFQGGTTDTKRKIFPSKEVRHMEMGMVQNVVAAKQAETMTQVSMSVQKKTMDMVELQGQMLQEMMASMGVGQNLNIQA